MKYSKLVIALASSGLLLATSFSTLAKEYVSDGNFEEYTIGDDVNSLATWTVKNNGAEVSATIAADPEGTKGNVIALVRSGTNGINKYAYKSLTGVEPSVTYTLSADVKLPTGVGKSIIVVNYQDGSGNNSSMSEQLATPSGPWHSISYEWTAPADLVADSVQFGVYFVNNTNEKTFYYDNFSFDDGQEVEVDNGITDVVDDAENDMYFEADVNGKHLQIMRLPYADFLQHDPSLNSGGGVARGQINTWLAANSGWRYATLEELTAYQQYFANVANNAEREALFLQHNIEYSPWTGGNAWWIGIDAEAQNEGDGKPAYYFEFKKSYATVSDVSYVGYYEFKAKKNVPLLVKEVVEINDDIDDDGYTNEDEIAAGSDPLNKDSIPADNDGDFISDVTDSDDDNDGTLDEEDAFAFNGAADTDTDNDGMPDEFLPSCDQACIDASGLTLDNDDDNDGVIDSEDAFPLDPSRSSAAYEMGAVTDDPANTMYWHTESLAGKPVDILRLPFADHLDQVDVDYGASKGQIETWLAANSDWRWATKEELIAYRDYFVELTSDQRQARFLEHNVEYSPLDNSTWMIAIDTPAEQEGDNKPVYRFQFGANNVVSNIAYSGYTEYKSGKVAPLIVRDTVDTDGDGIYDHIDTQPYDHFNLNGQRDISAALGATHMNSLYNFTSKPILHEGADTLHMMGASAIKLWFGSDYRINYVQNHDWKAEGDVASIKELAQTSYFADLFADPRINTYSLEMGTFKSHTAWKDGLSEVERVEIYNEVYDFTLHMMQTYQGTGKIFIVQNWEGDNNLGQNAPAEKVQGMIDWLNVRQRAITEARNEVGINNVWVVGAAEANKVGQPEWSGPRVLTDVFPHLTMDLYSYSDWYTQDSAAALLDDLNRIKQYAPDSEIFGSENVMLGEFGNKRYVNGGDREDGILLNEDRNGLVSKIEQEIGFDVGSRFSFFWLLYDSNRIKSHGLVLDQEIQEHMVPEAGLNGTGVDVSGRYFSIAHNHFKDIALKLDMVEDLAFDFSIAHSQINMQQSAMVAHDKFDGDMFRFEPTAADAKVVYHFETGLNRVAFQLYQTIDSNVSYQLSVSSTGEDGSFVDVPVEKIIGSEITDTSAQQNATGWQRVLIKNADELSKSSNYVKLTITNGNSDNVQLSAGRFYYEKEAQQLAIQFGGNVQSAINTDYQGQINGHEIVQFDGVDSWGNGVDTATGASPDLDAEGSDLAFGLYTDKHLNLTQRTAGVTRSSIYGSLATGDSLTALSSQASIKFSAAGGPVSLNGNNIGVNDGFIDASGEAIEVSFLTENYIKHIVLADYSDGDELALQINGEPVDSNLYGISVASWDASLTVLSFNNELTVTESDVVAIKAGAGQFALNSVVVIHNLFKDMDNDGVSDSKDAFPDNASASKDFDNDGMPDDFHAGCNQACIESSGLTIDTDDDNDGVLDINDAFLLNAAASTDTDGDGMPDEFLASCDQLCINNSGLSLDNDDDNDGVLDADDAFPTDSNKWRAPYVLGEAINDVSNAEYWQAESLAGVPAQIMRLEFADHLGIEGVDLVKGANKGEINTWIADNQDKGWRFATYEEMIAYYDFFTELTGEERQNRFKAFNTEFSPQDPNLWLILTVAQAQNEGDGKPVYRFQFSSNGNVSNVEYKGYGEFKSGKAAPLIVREFIDSDEDGVIDYEDQYPFDYDNDGYTDAEEELAGTDPKDAESLPLDTDGDLISDYIDEDDDNDGVFDSDDAFPLNAAASIDLDNDGLPEVFNEGCDAACIEGSGLELDQDTSTIEFAFSAPEDIVLEATSANMQLTRDMLGEFTQEGVIKLEIALEKEYSLGTYDVIWTATGLGEQLLTSTQKVTIVDTMAPVIAELESVEIDAVNVLTKVTSDSVGNVAAQDIVDGEIPLELVGSNVFTSGQHTLVWSAIDKSGNKVTSEQSLTIKPKLSFGVNSIFKASDMVHYQLHLSGQAQAYPISGQIKATITLNSEEEIVNSFTFSIDSFSDNGQTNYYQLPETVAIDNVAKVTFEFESAELVATNEASYVVEASNQELAPMVELVAQVDGVNSTVVNKDSDNELTLEANIKSKAQTSSYDVSWQSSEQSLTDLLQANNFMQKIDVNALTEGNYQVTVTVTDSESGLSTSVTSSIFVVATVTELRNDEDSDNDGVSDAQEGYGDSDKDGIADYLDAVSVTSVLPIAENGSQFILTHPGLSLRLGNIAKSKSILTAISAGIELADTNIDMQSEEALRYKTLSTVVDFEIHGLAVAGSSASIVLPLNPQSTLTGTEVYRKYSSEDGWYNFDEDENNYIASAPMVGENCPAIELDNYQEGFVTGGQCVRITIEDGGANDTDGLVNGVIVAPGFIANWQDNLSPEIVMDAQALTAIEGDIIVLDASKTFDYDGDTLSFKWQLIANGETESIGNSDKLEFTIPEVMADTNADLVLVVDDGALTSEESIDLAIVNLLSKVTAVIDMKTSDLSGLLYVGDKIELSGLASVANKGTLKYQWKEVNGLNLEIVNADKAEAYFIVPSLEEDTELELQLIVDNGIGDDTSIVSTERVVTIKAASADRNEDTAKSYNAGGSFGYFVIFIVLAFVSRMRRLV